VSLTFLKRDPSTVLAVAGTRIDRNAFRLLGSAEALWAESADSVARIRQVAEVDAAMLREQARQQGFEQGRAEGLACVLGSLEIERGMRTLLSDRIVALVEHCLRNMLGSFDDIELFRLRIRHLVKTSRPTGGARLRVCPSQAHLAAAAVAELVPSSGGESSWLTVVPDDACGPDALVLETSVGFVDASLELTLEGVRDILRRAMGVAAQGAPA
jgi:flagellar biosynthesis/type III secretory pathway protein FliH